MRFGGRRPGTRTDAKSVVRSSVNRSNPTNKDLIERTLKIWQPRSQRNLSPEDARWMVENITGFFDVLAEWSRAGLDTPNENSKQSVTTLSCKHGGEKVVP